MTKMTSQICVSHESKEISTSSSMLMSLHLQLFSHYMGAKAKVDNSPRKCATLEAKRAAAIHLVMAWFTSSATKKQKAINVGTSAVPLIIKKQDKVTPMSLISLSTGRPKHIENLD
jgi:hypothetical protein